MNTHKQHAIDAAKNETKIKALVTKINATLALGVRVTCNGVRIIKAHALKAKIVVVPFHKTTHKPFIPCDMNSEFRKENGVLINPEIIYE